MRRLATLLLLLLLAPAALAQRAEIRWDDRGVPHVAAADLDALFQAFGYAQMELHATTLLTLYAEHSGRAAALLGENHLDRDRLHHTLHIDERAETMLADASPTARLAMEGFAVGINRFAAERPERIPEALAPLLPVTALDVARRGVAAQLLFSTASRRAGAWSAGRTAARESERERTEALERARQMERQQRPGSNAWAVGADKSADGRAMLLGNPHLPWSDEYRFVEAHLDAPGYRVYGSTFVGMPIVAIGFTGRHGWTQTVNTQLTETVYELTLDGTGYRLDGRTRAFETDTLTLTVLLGPDSTRSEPLVRRRSVHGPVLAVEGDRALAHRVVLGEDPYGQWIRMARADTLTVFEDALREQHVVGFTTTYADRDGHVLHHYGGAAPIRARGDRAFWQGFVPGTEAALVWDRLHPYEDLPTVIDPASGWVQNANESSTWATWPLAFAPDAFPPYLAPRDLPLRAQHSLALLDTPGRFSLDDLDALRRSSRLLAADRLLPDLLAAAAQSRSLPARRAADVLAAWDRTAEADSRGGVLFQTWAQAAQQFARQRNRPLYARPWSPEDPRATPDGLADTQAAIAVLEQVVAGFDAAEIPLDVPWGAIHRLRLASADVPSSGAPGQLGSFRVMAFEPQEDGTATAFHGDTFVLLVAFGETPEARALLTYGNATETDSPHRTDQLEAAGRGTLTRVPFTPEEVEAATVRRTVVIP